VFPLAGTVLILMTLHSAPAPPTRPSSLPGLYLAYGIVHALDAHSTLHALHRADRREGNPLLPTSPLALLAVKAAGVTSTILLSEYLWTHGHRRTAVVTLVLVTTITGITAAHNYSLARHAGT